MIAPLDLHIEPLRVEDVGELLTVQRAAFLRDAQVYGNPFLPSLTQTTEQLRAELAMPDHVFLVAKLGARLVGSVRGVSSSRELYISRLLTAPDLEGRGIGGALLRAIEAATADEVDVYCLATGSKSTSNIAMYRRHGYEVVDETTDSAGVVVVSMRKQR